MGSGELLVWPLVLLKTIKSNASACWQAGLNSGVSFLSPDHSSKFSGFAGDENREFLSLATNFSEISKWNKKNRLDKRAIFKNFRNDERF
ncbi:hypothetical protein AVEN_66194-1 [Araneus ventricosus]|uniref:Uncharacterized protein n=1 Tax=Araneus ventricosus TaxID=182803 RepID=A0A4Y2JHG5_ARAVE|nr:hypothetical protein AVEN_66194-1 [Araneus ventricosus]